MNPPHRRGGAGPRILFVATDLSTGGGVNKVIRDLAVLFRRRFSAEVTVVNARSDSPSSYEFPDDVPVRSGGRKSLAGYFGLLLSLRRTRPDVVISSWTQDNILVTLAFLFSRSRVVLVEHSSWHFPNPMIRFLRRLTYPLASQVVVLNKRDRAHYHGYLENVRLIPNPVKIGGVEDSRRREKLILAVGHLEPLKQFDQAILAFAYSKLEDQGWSLAIIGSGSETRRLTELIKSLGLKRVSIVDSAHLPDWYDRASLLIVSSKLESFSLVLAEAMSKGVIPVAYESDGPSYLLEGFPDHLVPVGDVDALSRKLIRYAGEADDQSLREALSASIRTRFAPDVVAGQWEELLEK